MQFSDDDLRRALSRKEPSEDFAARVMERISKPQALVKPLVFAWWRQKWAVAAALAACLLLMAGLVQYRRYEQKQIEARKAREQAVFALRLASEKLNGALRQALFIPRNNH
jgi:hypothetical protein